MQTHHHKGHASRRYGRRAALRHGLDRRSPRLAKSSAAVALSGAIVLGASVGASAATRVRDTSSGVNVAAAQALLAKYEAIPTYPSLGTAFNARKLDKGKLIYIIPASANGNSVEIAQADKQIGELAGAKVVVFSNTGVASEWQQGIEQAITAHANLIDLQGQDPSEFAPQIAQAAKAGIRVSVTSFSDPSAKLPAGLAGGVDFPFSLGGKLEAAFILANAKKPVDVDALISSAVPEQKYATAGIKAEFAALCSSCHVRYTDEALVTNWPDFNQATAAALEADPKISYIIASFDAMVQYAEAGLDAAGKSGSVKIVSFNGTPSVLSLIKPTSPVQMDIGISAEWIGYASMVNDLRVVAGGKPSVITVPPRVFDTSNVASTGNPPSLQKGFGGNFLGSVKQVLEIGS